MVHLRRLRHPLFIQRPEAALVDEDVVVLVAVVVVALFVAGFERQCRIKPHDNGLEMEEEVMGRF